MRSKRSEWVNNASIIAGTWWICGGIMCVPIATLNGWTWIKRDVKYVNIFEIYTSNILEWTWTSEVESSNKCVYFNRIDFCFGSHSFETRIGNPILVQSMCFSKWSWQQETVALADGNPRTKMVWFIGANGKHSWNIRWICLSWWLWVKWIATCRSHDSCVKLYQKH